MVVTANRGEKIVDFSLEFLDFIHRLYKFNDELRAVTHSA
jgi:hypothetical protein